MSKFLVILRREYAQVVKKKSFLIMTLLTPVIMAGLMIGPSFLIRKGMTGQAESYAVIDLDGNGLGEQLVAELANYKLEDTTVEALTLERLAVLEPSDSAGYARAYDTLLQLVRARELGYLLILEPEAHLADTNRLLVTNSDNRQTIGRLERRLSKVISIRRLEASNVNLPIDSVLALTESIVLPRQDTKGEYVPREMKFLAGVVLMMLIYLLVLMDGQALMQSVIDEKSARIMEVLVSSATPFQIMTGKIFGTGLAALTQVSIWIVAGAGLMVYSSSSGTEIPSAISRTILNPATVISFTGFLVLGYLLFSTMFALIGSVVNSPKEAQPMLLPVILILFLPGMMVGMAALEFPDAGWVKVMSFIPTYTPLVMMTRVCAVVPTVEGNTLLSPIMAEALIGMVLIALTLVGAMWVTSRVFRVGILMYGKRPTLPEVFKWIRHK